MPRLKARRGAFVVITAILMTSMVALMALAVDFARLTSLKAELQTSADAAAHAGAIQWLPKHYGTGSPSDSATAYANAHTYANRNKAMQDTVRVDSITIGKWDDATRTFNPAGTPKDAVRVVVSRQATGLFMNGLGVTLPRITAKATAWGGAPVEAYGCIKPWAMPYPLLMKAIMNYRGHPAVYDSLVKTFTTDDLNTLMAMPTSARQFDLHLGNGSVNDPAVDSLNISGNYQAVQLGSYWNSKTGTYSNPGPVNGAQAYRDQVSGAGPCYSVVIGDSLQTNQGLAGAQNTVDPLSIPHNSPYGICSTIRGYDDNTNKNNSTYGDCLDANGNKGVTAVSFFYVCATGCNGSSIVAVKMMAAFTIDKVYPAKSSNGQTPAFDMAEIQGTFAALSGSGRVSHGGASPILKVIIVQ